MRYFIFTILVMLSMQSGYGQACYVHAIKYVGTIEANHVEVIQVQLPAFHFSQKCSRKKNDSLLCWATMNPKNARFEIEIRSDSFSKNYTNPDIFLDLFKGNKPMLPIIFTVLDNHNKVQEIKLELDWQNLEMKVIEDGQIPNTFELDLKTIKVFPQNHP